MVTPRTRAIAVNSQAKSPKGSRPQRQATLAMFRKPANWFVKKKRVNHPFFLGDA